MQSKAASWGLFCNGVVGEVAADQRWVLAAMQTHGPALVRMLWRILGCEQDVCDAYQNTFLQLSHWAQGRKPDNVKAFVFRTASNVAISVLRRKERHNKVCRAMAERPVPTSQDNPLGDLDAGHLRQTLRENIARLPEAQRNVVVLRDLGELPYSQVAAMLGITVASARVYRCRALRLLSAWMARRKDGRS